MIKSYADTNSNEPGDEEDADEGKWNPWLYGFCDLICIPESLKTWGFDLLFFSFSLEHAS